MNCTNLPKVMVSMARNRSLEDVLHSIVDGIAECRDVALARIWLMAPGDICDQCIFEKECMDPSTCLHLAASSGKSNEEGKRYDHLDGRFRRFPIGIRKIGQIAESGKPVILREIQGDENWIADKEWVKKENIRTFGGQPLVYRDEILGVLGIFDRGALKQEDFEWMRVFADHASVSIANARAFEEIEFLKARLEEENDYLRQEVTEALGTTEMVGTSPGLKKVLEQIQLVAPTDTPVLINGESGTGKELVARAIHQNSPRANRALIKVNCGAVPDSLFESEFFGHMKGAFTGAVKDKPGKFELADGGTIFLDEIGEIPLPMQAKLLRVLQEQELERIGDTRSRRINIRIIAATHRDLAKEIDAGKFRQDLYYRLSVFPVEIPPLRHRREDIEPLASRFIIQAAQRMNRRQPRLSHSALRQLTQYDWPGNVRELQNAIERAVILSRGNPLQFQLPNDRTRETHKPHASSGSDQDNRIWTRDELRQKETESIQTALNRSKGRIFGNEGAAEILGMKPTTLASRIKALGIRKP